MGPTWSPARGHAAGLRAHGARAPEMQMQHWSAGEAVGRAHSPPASTQPFDHGAPVPVLPTGFYRRSVESRQGLREPAVFPTRVSDRSRDHAKEERLRGRRAPGCSAAGVLARPPRSLTPPGRTRRRSPAAPAKPAPRTRAHTIPCILLRGVKFGGLSVGGRPLPHTWGPLGAAWFPSTAGDTWLHFPHGGSRCQEQVLL